MRSLIRSEVTVAAPAQQVWNYVTDWPRQGEWIPLTRVERLDAARSVGGRLRAWTGVGPAGFWDPMTIIAWEEFQDGANEGRARCEVLHTGNVVRGEAGFSVQAQGPASCRFTWWEHVDVPGGVLGHSLFRLVDPLNTRVLGAVLHKMARLAEQATP